MTNMDAEGRQRAKDVISRLRTGGTTNLSGGLLKAIDMIVALDGSEGRTRSIMLFTDGVANNGITQTEPLCAAVKGAFETSPTAKATCFTFGFGADHNEDMLRAIADVTMAQYYYIKGTDDIPTSFADCLGGLVSVTAQNATLTLETATPPSAGPRDEISKVLGQYKEEGRPDGAPPGPHTRVLALGDLYSEDSKDVLFELKLPALSAEAPAAAVLRATLRYFNVAAARIEEVSALLEVARPAQTPANQPVNLKLDEQRNRMRVAEAMEAASKLADKGRLGEGRELLAQCQLAVAGSSSAPTPLSAGLCDELSQLAVEYEDTCRYRSVGAKMSKMSAMSHQMQRSNHASAAMYKAGGSQKSAMKKAWFSSFSS